MSDPTLTRRWPGIPARWTSSAKSGVGTALGASSHVWFTLSHGILDEIYYPRVDSACTRDLGLIVTDGESYFSEEKRDARSEVVVARRRAFPRFACATPPPTAGIALKKKYSRIRPGTSSSSACASWRSLGDVAQYRLFALLAPHLNNRGDGNTAWVGDYKGSPMLFAERNGYALALACSAPWLARSVGFVGFSDGWQELRAHRRLRQSYRAGGERQRRADRGDRPERVR